MPLHSAHCFALVVQLCLLHRVQAGAYYGHKQVPQHLPQQHQQLQLPHIPQGKERIPQQQYLGKELPHLPYGNEMPMLPHYGKEQPQMPLPSLGKGMSILVYNVK